MRQHIDRRWRRTSFWQPNREFFELFQRLHEWRTKTLPQRKVPEAERTIRVIERIQLRHSPVPTFLDGLSRPGTRPNVYHHRRPPPNSVRPSTRERVYSQVSCQAKPGPVDGWPD